MSAFTAGKHWALTAVAFLIVALSRPTLSEAQTRRDSLVNPSQSGPQGIVGGQPGPSVGRTQPSFGVLPSIDFGPADPSNLKVPRSRTAQDLPLPLDPDPQRPRRGLPALKPFFGKPDGITLDMAVEILLHNSLDLAQSRGDISQAEADLITAGLRTNPIAYVDTQGVPYGKYTRNSSGGPNQFDFNIVHPLDLSHKRQARTKSAWLNSCAVEAKYRDVVRLAIDNLYTAYVDALLAQRNVEFEDRKNPTLLKERGANTSIFSVIDRDDANEAFEEAMRTLSLQLNLPLGELKQRGLYGRLHFTRRDEPPLPPEDELVRIALANRPDLMTQRIIVSRSDADIAVARANRFDDALLMYQPYTFYTGIPNVTPRNMLAWAVGVTVPLPIYNRQQGNIAKAATIASQARTQLALLEKTVEADVRRAVRQHESTLRAVERVKAETLSDEAMAIKPLMKRFEKGGPSPDLQMLMLLERLQRLISDDDDNQLAKLDELKIQHRRSMLKLNTAVGQRVLP
jgi:cobalt-zinc-cadmium efflux system outer membrane protein